MRNGHPGQHASRLALAGAAAGLLWLSSAGAAGAATPPDPLGGALTSVTDPATAAVTQLLGGSTTPAAPSLPAPPSLPGPPSLPAPPALPALPALPGQAPGDAGPDGSGVSADAEAPAGDDLAAVDAAVAEFLGVCARVPQSVLPVQADIVVLDRNVIAELVGAGVPLQPLVVPCPKAAASGPAAPQSPGSSSSDSPRPAASADPGSALPTALAFTGAEIAPTLLLAGGLLALGIAFLRKARQLAVVR
jgi:hypothetical protein